METAIRGNLFVVRSDGIFLTRVRNRTKIYSGSPKLYLTEAGKKLTEEKILPVLALENSVFAEMTQEERNQLLALTEKYVEIFREKVSQIL